MKLLIDTHVALWALARPERLPADLARGMREGEFEVFLSLASLWEVAIKHSIALAAGARKLDWSAADPLVALHGVDAPGLIEKIPASAP